jgi:hypothetical protein
MAVSRLAGVIGLLAFAGSASAQVTADWLDSVDGNWSNPFRWSTGIVPNNDVFNNYVARILLPGSYTVTLDIDVEVSGFQLEAVDAVLAIDPGRTLNTVGNNVFRGAAITGSGGSEIFAGGNTLLAGGGSYTNVSSFTLDGGATFDEADDWDLCDTCLNLTADTGWLGTGSFNLDNASAQSEIVVEASGSLSVTGPGSRGVNSTDAGNRLINRGALEVDLGNAADGLDVLGAGFENQAGKVTVTRGTLRSDEFRSLSGTTLIGGDWLVEADGRVQLDGVTITTLDVDVELKGGASFDALDALDAIGAAGGLGLSNRSFSTLGGLDLQGQLRLGAGSSLDVNGDISTFNAGAFEGGEIELRGQLVGENTRLEVVKSRFLLGQGGSLLFRDASGTNDGLAGLRRIDAGGDLEIVDGRALTQTVSNLLEVGGTLLLSSSGLEGPGGRGSMLEVRGYTQEAGSELQIGIGSATDFGQIVSDTLTFGTGAAGETAGTLTLILDPGAALALGDEILIFDLATPGGLFGAGFDSLATVGSLGGGLSFEQFSSVDGFGVRVVPAPAGATALLLGGLAAARRRR